MPFSDAFLQALTQAQVQGDFPPFTLGSPAKINHYVRKIVERLQQNTHLLVEADFGSYGSGYASYIPIKLFKKDRSDTLATLQKQGITYRTAGLLLYVSRLAPYWFYGGANWLAHYEAGRYQGGGNEFLEPEHPAAIDPQTWQTERQWLEAVLTHFRYALLTPEELVQPAPAAITHIPTVLADPPYRVFDCFFYWMD